MKLTIRFTAHEDVSNPMAMDLSFLLPPKGRPIAPGEPVPLPTTDELRVHAVAATAPLLSISGAILCLGVLVAAGVLLIVYVLGLRSSSSPTPSSSRARAGRSRLPSACMTFLMVSP